MPNDSVDKLLCLEPHSYFLDDNYSLLYPTNPSSSGGEEVLLDVGGQDATEAFEDVGHSDEAREILDGLIVGSVKRVDGDPAPKSEEIEARLEVENERREGEDGAAEESPKSGLITTVITPQIDTERQTAPC